MIAALNFLLSYKRGKELDLFRVASKDKNRSKRDFET